MTARPRFVEETTYGYVPSALSQKRVDLQVTAIDIDVLSAALAEAKVSAASSDQVYETDAHRTAAERLRQRLAVLYRQITDEVAP